MTNLPNKRVTENVQKASQLWCLPKHSNKNMDADLCFDIIALLDQKDAEWNLVLDKLIEEKLSINMKPPTRPYDPSL